MVAFKIEVQDADVLAALQGAVDRVSDLQPVLQVLGDDIVERTKRRFETSTAPDGAAWAPNAAATLSLYAARLGKGLRKKNGELNAAGERRLAAKKPLIGESGDLRRQIVAVAESQAVEIRATPIYAAIHQFGGKAGRGLKVTIPARPYLPVRQDGSLYPQESALIVDSINELLLDLP